ncbi:MAG: ABC transporter transmembrane domain-containing protein, partial [Robiginitalea sp.]|uniref:ABC transporter transmembrane domain-containing protein n=2 Tax=Robiginitalea sp. TaxID=1902411 RepID=UPI003C761DFE
MEKESGKAFDLYLFKRVLAFTRPYPWTFLGTAVAAILLTIFSILTPLILKEIIDVAITQKQRDLLMTLSLAMVGVLIGQVVCQLLFTYYANWLGESVIMDMRTRLFRQMIGFRMKYFSNSSIGVLVTRSVADLQRIGEIFSQGFFTIVADLLKMLAASAIMLWLNWKLALLVFAILPLILYATRLFQRAMKVAFIEVRAQVSNLNS